MRGFLILVLIVAAVGGLLYFYGGSFKSQARRDAPAATETPATDQPSGTGATTPVANPVVVDIVRTQPRAPANGGSAVVLFTDAPDLADRNTVTCLNIWDAMDSATASEIQVGLRKGADGAVEALRPLYWMDVAAMAPGEHGCDERMAKYDYARAQTIRANNNVTKVSTHFHKL